MNKLIQRLIELDKVLLVSYYKSFNVKLALELANVLESFGYRVCIKNLSTIQLSLKTECSEGSKKIILEAQSEDDLDEEFKFATSYKILKNARYIIKAQRIQQNVFKVELKEESILLRVLENSIVDEEFGDIENFIIKLLNEWNGSGSLKEIINIVSYKINANKDIVRSKLGFLRDIGVVEIENGLVRLKKSELMRIHNKSFDNNGGS